MLTVQQGGVGTVSAARQLCERTLAASPARVMPAEAAHENEAIHSHGK